MEKRKADQFVIGKNPLHFCGKQVRKLFKVEGIRREREIGPYLSRLFGCCRSFGERHKLTDTLLPFTETVTVTVWCSMATDASGMRLLCLQEVIHLSLTL